MHPKLLINGEGGPVPSPHGRTPAMVKSVLIADDNTFVRQRLCGLFGGEADFEICGEAENGREAIEEAQELHLI